MPDIIQERVLAFTRDFNLISPTEIVHKHILCSDCFALVPSLHSELKRSIANHFAVDETHVFVVGSAKLGFSLASPKRYNPFSLASDIDIAICDTNLFDIFWDDVFRYWERNEFWEYYKFNDFRKYLFRGWIRPDKLPPSHTFQRASEWWEFFRQLTYSRKYGPFKISGALYKTLYFLESYQRQSVLKCIQEGGNYYEDNCHES